jgi:hypothetical protein
MFAINSKFVKQSSLVLAFCSVFTVLSLTSCKNSPDSKTATSSASQRLSAAHQAILKKGALKQADKGNSFKGRWIFTVNAEPGTKPKDYTVLSKNILDDKGAFQKSQTVKPEDLKAGDFLHAGFITLEEGGKGYDLTGYGKVKIPYTGLQQTENKLRWDFTWIPVAADKREFYAQEFHREAVYDPTTDTISGSCSSVIYKLVPGSNGKSTTVVLPVGNYNWQASRLSEEDFQKMANSGKRSPALPNAEFTVYVNNEHPKIKELIAQELKLPLEQRIALARKEASSAN